MLSLLLAVTPALPIPTPGTTEAKPAIIPSTPSVVLAQAPTTATTNDPLPSKYPYVSLQAGVGFPNTLKGEFDFLGLITINNTINLNTGFNGEAAIGYKFPDFRTDLSIGYSSFESNRQTLTVPNFGSASVPGRGSVNLFTVMANAYYDFKIKKQDGTRSRWSPYVGVGIGWGDLSTPGCASTVGGASCNAFSSGSGGTFAYQAKIGVSYRATNSGFAFLEGGYLGTTSATVENVSYDPFGTWRINLGWRQKI